MCSSFHIFTYSSLLTFFLEVNHQIKKTDHRKRITLVSYSQGVLMMNFYYILVNRGGCMQAEIVSFSGPIYFCTIRIKEED